MTASAETSKEPVILEPQRRSPLSEPTTIPHFNPSNNADVYAIKSLTEEMFKLLTTLRNNNAADARCIAIAMTHFETGAMFAVKALFANAREVTDVGEPDAD